MTGVGSLLLRYGATAGHLVWRGSRRFWHSVFAAFAVPFIGFVCAGVIIGRGNRETTGPEWAFPLSIGAVAILVAAHWRK